MGRYTPPSRRRQTAMPASSRFIVATVGSLALLAMLWQPSEQVHSATHLRGAAPVLRSMKASRVQASPALHLRGGSATADAKKDASTEAHPMTAAVESAIESLRNKCMDAGKSNDELAAALNLIALYVGNAAKNPSETKFHRIRAGNKAFAGKVSLLEGATQVLEACEFKPQQQPAAEGKDPELFYCIESDQVANLGHAEKALQAAIQSAKTVAADTLGQMVTSAAEGDAAIEEVWRLSCQLEGHEGDVRGVAATEDGRIVSASRDKSVKVWEMGKEGAAYAEAADLQGHEYHVASCATVPATARHGELLLSGSYDLTSAGKVSIPPVVNVWAEGKLKKSLQGHTGTVSYLASNPEGDKLYSASWDKSIRVWDRESLELAYELKGHSQAVWSLLPLPQGKLLSASADRSIRLWDQKECIGTLNGHTDCVRALALLPDGRFVSAGNDNTIKVWSLDLSGNSLEQTCGFCLATLIGHQNFVYTLAVLPNGDIVSGGEDRTVRVWRDSKCVCTIRHPDTVWSVATMPNGDIVSACADGKTRVFTQSEERMASEEVQKEWEALLANCTIASHTMGGLQLDKLPGPEALEVAGTSDGQTRVIRQGSKAFAFAWSAASNKWEPVGEVVDSQGDSKNTMGGGKMSLDGVEYDFVFDIEVEEGRMEKLGINKKDNPYMVASDFIDKYELNPDYMETIVSWLDEEMGKLDPEKQRSESDLSMLDKDPYNEGKVYRAGSAQNLQKAEETYYDPFTGKKLGGRAGDDSDDDEPKPKAPAKPAVHVPSSTTSAFPGAPKPEALLKKVGELNGNIAAELAMSEAEMATFKELVEGLQKPGFKPSDAALSLLEDKLIKWPQSAVFPMLDVTRALMAIPDVASKWATAAMGAYSMAYAQEGGATAETLQQAQAKDMVLKTLMAGSCAGEGEKPPMATVLMAQRALCNAFQHEGMKSLLQLHLGTTAAVFATTGMEGKKLVAGAHATLLLNYAVAFKGLPIDPKVSESLLGSAAGIIKAMGDDADTVTMYRVVAAVGTLIYGQAARIQQAAALRVEALVRDRILGADKVRGGMGEPGDPRVQQCCYQMLEAFDVVRLMAPGVKKPENDEEFNTILKLCGNMPVVVDFYADWCGPCKVIAPAFEAMAAEHPGAAFIKVNVDELRGTAQKYKVEAMPTFKFLSRGQAVHTIQGADEAGLRNAVSKFAAQTPAAAAAK